MDILFHCLILIWHFATWCAWILTVWLSTLRWDYDFIAVHVLYMFSMNCLIVCFMFFALERFWGCKFLPPFSWRSFSFGYFTFSSLVIDEEVLLWTDFSLVVNEVSSIFILFRVVLTLGTLSFVIVIPTCGPQGCLVFWHIFFERMRCIVLTWLGIVPALFLSLSLQFMRDIV